MVQKGRIRRDNRKNIYEEMSWYMTLFTTKQSRSNYG